MNENLSSLFNIVQKTLNYIFVCLKNYILIFRLINKKTQFVNKLLNNSNY